MQLNFHFKHIDVTGMANFYYIQLKWDKSKVKKRKKKKLSWYGRLRDRWIQLQKKKKKTNKSTNCWRCVQSLQKSQTFCLVKTKVEQSTKKVPKIQRSKWQVIIQDITDVSCFSLKTCRGRNCPVYSSLSTTSSCDRKGKSEKACLLGLVFISKNEKHAVKVQLHPAGEATSSRFLPILHLLFHCFFGISHTCFIACPTLLNPWQ